MRHKYNLINGWYHRSRCQPAIGHLQGRWRRKSYLHTSGGVTADSLSLGSWRLNMPSQVQPVPVSHPSMPWMQEHGKIFYQERPNFVQFVRVAGGSRI